MEEGIGTEGETGITAEKEMNEIKRTYMSDRGDETRYWRRFAREGPSISCMCWTDARMDRSARIVREAKKHGHHSCSLSAKERLSQLTADRKASGRNRLRRRPMNMQTVDDMLELAESKRGEDPFLIVLAGQD